MGHREQVRVPPDAGGRGGGSRRTFYIGAGKTEDVRLPRGGDYTVTANASDNKIIPLYGEFGLEGGVRYKSVLGIQSAR